MSGRIEVITGPMFCGKTEELIRRVRRARIAGQYVEVFTPETDTRTVGQVVSHAEQRLDGVPIQVVKPDFNLIRAVSMETTKVIALDEAQFFEEALVPQVQRLADGGMRVIVAGLDLDYRAEPFEIMGRFMVIAEDVQKLTAVCMRCKAEATRTQRLGDVKTRVMIGAGNEYEARCRSCFKVPGTIG